MNTLNVAMTIAMIAVFIFLAAESTSSSDDNNDDDDHHHTLKY